MHKGSRLLRLGLAITFAGLGALPSTAGASPEEAAALLQAGHWKRARAMVEPEVKAHPQDARFAYLLAQVKMAFRDIRGALPFAQHAVELDGQNSNYHLKLGQVYGELAARASIFQAGSLAIKFRKEVETALRIDPQNLEALDSMMQFKFQAPGLMGGDKSAAHALAEEILRLNPSQGYLARAELAQLEKNQAEVEANYRKAVEADPHSYRAATSLAKYYVSPPQPKPDLAAPPALQALELDPSRAEAYGILARVYALEQRWGDLESLLAAAEKSVPDDLLADYEAARAQLENSKELARAEACAKKYLSQEPEGEEPDAADGHRLLGLVIEKEGRDGEAQAEIETALQLRPTFKAAQEDLKRLGKR